MSCADEPIQPPESMNECSKSKTNDHKASRVTRHKVVSEKTWLAGARNCCKKKKHSPAYAINLAGSAALLVKVEKPYVFDTPQGKETIAELFDRDAVS